MKYTQKQINEIRLRDIDFFAHKYAELFGDTFEKNKDEFYDEIKRELSAKAPRYVLVDNDPVHGAQGQSFDDRIEFSKNASIHKQEIRIHELFHSYNTMNRDRHGLKNFKDTYVLKDLDEGTTEMFTQIICGNDKGVPGAYPNEVELARFLTDIIGIDDMIKATRGKPEILTNKIDDIFGTIDLVTDLSKMLEELDDAENLSYDEETSKLKSLLYKIRLEELRGKGPVEKLFELAEKKNDKELIDKLTKTDKEYGYKVLFKRDNGIGCAIFDPEKKTLADLQQEMLKQDIYDLDVAEDDELQSTLEIEFKKFLYDKITFQKHFLNHKGNYVGIIKLNAKDLKYAEKFRSELDGSQKRLGGKLGMQGPGYAVQEIDSAPHLINEDTIKKMYIPGIKPTALKDYRFRMWAEKLNIEQEEELIDKWGVFILNNYCKSELKYLHLEDAEYEKAISEIREKLVKQEKGIIDKYIALSKTEGKEEQNIKVEEENTVQELIKSNALFEKSKTKKSKLNQTLHAIKDLLCGKSKDKDNRNADD